MFPYLYALFNTAIIYSDICISNSTVSSAIWKKHEQVSFSKTIKIARVRRTSLPFVVFEKLTSACFFKLHEKHHCLFIIYMTKLCRIDSYAFVTCKKIYSLRSDCQYFLNEKTFVRTNRRKTMCFNNKNC